MLSIRKLKKSLSFLYSLYTVLCFAQTPSKPNAIEIYHQIEKLNFLGSVLYIAAHPDDENTKLISFFANHTKARTAYLSLTRGDGGQNLIGTELQEQLGVIRTQELLEARKIDGGEQFFTRANDFGYSKNPEETLTFWNKDTLLSDMIRIIRKFQPDIIINRFDHRTPGTTHGHHTTSALLSYEAFDLAHDQHTFPNQLKQVTTWQPKRLFYNLSWWFYGGKEKFDLMDKSHFIPFETGIYYSSLGKSNQEIAALSRSKHQSQGFGTMGTRGDETEYLEFLKGTALHNPKNIFEGIDTSWNRIIGGAPIGTLLNKIIAEFDFSNPATAIPDLIKVYSLIQNLDENHWKLIKTEEIKKIIVACSGLYLEAITEQPSACPGETIKVNIEAINRSNINIELVELSFLPEKKPISKNITLQNNTDQNFQIEIKLPSTLDYTTPFWLKEKGSIGMYKILDPKNIGLADIIRASKITFIMSFNGTIIPLERNLVYKHNSLVKGEVYSSFDIVPEITTKFINKVLIFKDQKTKSIAVKIKAGKDRLKGTLHLEIPPDWHIVPNNIPFELANKGTETTFYFNITPPKKTSEATLKSIITLHEKEYDQEQINIHYNHIAWQQILQPSEAKIMKLDLKTKGRKIGYIMGAGDHIPEKLTEMGYQTTLLNPETLTKEKINHFDAILVGIRAYNTVHALHFKQPLLFDYVKNGGTLIVQYNTSGKLVTQDLAPYELKLSNDRVTDEKATVRFLAPHHKILNKPNKITSRDFEGWIQEQGLYYPQIWSNEFETIISSNDKGETPKNSAILVAKYGKGYYIYTGLSFFRELPAGVPGAYRLLANMIGINQSSQRFF